MGFFYVSVNPVNQIANWQLLEKAKMPFLTKEGTDKDRSLKRELLLATDSQKNEKISGEPICKKFCYFSNEKDNFNIEKNNFLENTLCYVNQGFLSTVKNG